MSTVWLCHRGERQRCFDLSDRCLQVGSGARSDIVIQSSELPGAVCLVQPHGGTAYVYDLQQSPGAKDRRVFGLRKPFELGSGYTLFRERVRESSRHLGATDRLSEQSSRRSISLVVGRGSEARRVIVRERPISIGSDPRNHVCIHDRAVSAFHCRVEPCMGAVSVRDLASTNGTWVDRSRVDRASLSPGVGLRVGRTELRVVVRGDETSDDREPIIAESASMLAVLGEVERFARLPWPVLIQGESGVGKERVACALHRRGHRASGPFIALNAGGLPAQLVESELFGHERGAFTGAVQEHRGVFERACGGTLFLDEIGELPRELQSRLLRVLETWTVRRVGGERDRRVDVRLVCATHRDLRAMVAAGSFRADLFYRINRLLVEVPPLRERVRDVAPLAAHFLADIERDLGERTLSAEAVTRLSLYSWPGNARELRNVLCFAAASVGGPELGVADIERALQRIAGPSEVEVSNDVLERVVAQHGGNVTAAARSLGLPRTTLRDRLRQYGRDGS